MNEAPIRRLAGRRVARSTVALLLAMLAPLGCGLGDTPIDEVEPASVPDNPTWISDVGPRLDYYCAACHDPDGFVGAKAGFDFSSYPASPGGIVETIQITAFEERSMPPGAMPKMPPRALGILRRWETNGYPECAPGQCPDGKSCVDGLCE